MDLKFLGLEGFWPEGLPYEGNDSPLFVTIVGYLTNIQISPIDTGIETLSRHNISDMVERFNWDHISFVSFIFMFREQCYTLQYLKIEPSVNSIAEIDYISHRSRCSD